jgi:alpha-tubulin suppressor-like RCC1 family protein
VLSKVIRLTFRVQPNGIYSWGAGINGQLGIGSEKLAISAPVEVTDLHGEDILTISSSGDVSAAITKEGELYTWGKTRGGQMKNQSHQTAAQTQNLLSPSYVNAEGINF